MLIDESHKKWMLFTIAASVVLVVAYVFYYKATIAVGSSPSGGSVPGLIWGSLALAIFVFCCLLALRKKVRIWRLGRAQTWMRAHIWLGLLTIPLVLCHSGMKLGNNLTLALMILYGVVMISGIFGLVMQNMIPAIMLERVKAETTFEQIEHVYEILRQEADDIVTGICGPLDAQSQTGIKIVPEAQPPKRAATVMVVKDKGVVQGKAPKERGKGAMPVQGAEPLKALYLKEVRPFLDRRIPSECRLVTSQGAVSIFEHARTLLPESAHGAVEDLASICEERRQLGVQQRLHAWLHVWLFIHGPLSYLLLVLTLIHAVVSPLWY